MTTTRTTTANRNPQAYYNDGNKDRTSIPISYSLGGSKLRDIVMEASRSDVHASSLDLTGIVWLEHINLVVGTSKEEAEYFYLETLGLTRDAGKSFHVNLGQQQFHLATATTTITPRKNSDNENEEDEALSLTPQRFAGSIGLAIPDLQTVRPRLQQAQMILGDKTWYQLFLNDSKDANNNDKVLTVRGPWGNIFHLYSIQDDDDTICQTKSPMKMVQQHAEGGSYGPHRMAVRGQPGIRYIEIACPHGTSNAIANFYHQILGCTTYRTQQLLYPKVNVDNYDNHENNETTQDKTDPTQEEGEVVVPVVCVSVGPGVHLVFVEQPSSSSSSPLSTEAIQAMKGIHICIYVSDFANLYQRLAKHGLLWTNPRFTHLDSCDTWEEAMKSRTLRFKDIINLETGQKIMELEHETRPMRHGQYLKVPKYEPK